MSAQWEAHETEDGATFYYHGVNGWEMHFHVQPGLGKVPYFFHQRTGTTLWEPPSGVIPPKAFFGDVDPPSSSSVAEKTKQLQKGTSFRAPGQPVQRSASQADIAIMKIKTIEKNFQGKPDLYAPGRNVVYQGTVFMGTEPTKMLGLFLFTDLLVLADISPSFQFVLKDKIAIDDSLIVEDTVGTLRINVQKANGDGTILTMKSAEDKQTWLQAFKTANIDLRTLSPDQSSQLSVGHLQAAEEPPRRRSQQKDPAVKRSSSLHRDHKHGPSPESKSEKDASDAAPSSERRGSQLKRRTSIRATNASLETTSVAKMMNVVRRTSLLMGRGSMKNADILKAHHEKKDDSAESNGAPQVVESSEDDEGRKWETLTLGTTRIRVSSVASRVENLPPLPGTIDRTESITEEN